MTRRHGAFRHASIFGFVDALSDYQAALFLNRFQSLAAVGTVPEQQLLSRTCPVFPRDGLEEEVKGPIA